MDNKKFFAALVIFLIVAQFRFIYSPGQNRLKYLGDLIRDREADLITLERLSIEYTQAKDRAENDSPKVAREDFSLFSYTGELLESHKIEKNVAAIQPLPLSEQNGFTIERLKLTLRDMTLKKLYAFLLEIETSQNALYISDFRMNKNRDKPFLLNAEMEILAVKRPEA